MSAIKELAYGRVEIVVHKGQITQIEATKKMHLPLEKEGNAKKNNY
ncbi:DUF2292 domain-containing protein [Halalkalibacter kiskunsagensis]|uniref:DUF2292 domain-containing protein n=1 Tax=Halalkalibacter kiskunsagensis TaxID=1548599 RepID=A0ABV6KKX3_9BACI